MRDTNASGNRMTYYNGITWNSMDLISSKNAVRMLLNRGTSITEIDELEQLGCFGNLDVQDCIEEYFDR